MKFTHLARLGLIACTVVSGAGLAILPASALRTTTAAAGTSSTTAGTSAADQTKLKLIISRGDTEITRRLSTLNTLSAKISAAIKLSATDKATLSAEVSDEVSGLTSLKSKLDADTDLPTAKTDAQSIFNDYRVYALVVPKIALVRTADAQQVAESKLTDLATKLQTKITAAGAAGKDVTALQAQLTDLTAKNQASQAISSAIESGVVNLQPSDYNSDHAVLSGDRDQLKTAQTDITAASTDAKTIITGLKSL